MIQLNSNTFFFAQAQLYTVPEFKVTDRMRDEWVPVGNKNDYYDYLIELFNGSSKHGGIIERTNRYIVADGWQISERASIEEKAMLLPKIERVNTYNESLHELTIKLQADRKLFGGFAIRVVKTRMGSEMLYHVPFHWVRRHKENAIFAVSEQWKKQGGVKAGLDSADSYVIPAFKKGADYSESLYVHRDYRPGMGVYPLPDYVNAIPYIDCDRELAKFNLNNIKNGFLGGYLINFPNGEPTPEQKTQIEAKIKSKFAGSEGDRILLDFSNGKDFAVTITPLTPPDLASQFQILNEQINNEVFIGHGFPKILLGVGESTGLSIGEQKQIQLATESFMTSYGKPVQKTYVDLFNWLFDVNSLEFKQLPVIGNEMPESMMSSYMTANEIRAKFGLPVEEKTAENTAQNKFAKDSEDFSLFDEYGIDSEGVEILHSSPLQFVKVGDSYKPVINERIRFAQYQFADLSERKQQILSILNEGELTDVNSIAQAMDENTNDVIEDIEELIEDKYITKNMSLTKKGKNNLPTDRVEIRYRYSLRSDAPSLSTKGEGSRPFCKELMRRNKLYTREEIDTLSARYSAQQGRYIDVWMMRGGWYRRPNTTNSVPFCRHIWESVIVMK